MNSLFFYLSKIFWTVAQPLSVIGLLIAISLATFALSRRRAAFVSGGLALTMLALSSWTTFGSLLLQPLELRFQRPAQMPEQVAGIVVLGGAFEGGVNSVRGGHELGESADRMTEAAALALRYPQARLAISGGSGIILRERVGDGETAPAFFEALGVARSRLLLESDSRNTEENALFTKRLANPQPGETWLLVTSAFHMPRSMGLFRKAGWPVVPWPADYRTAGNEGFELCRENAHDCLETTTIAIREWIGLTAYRLTGKIGDWFPAP